MASPHLSLVARARLAGIALEGAVVTVLLTVAGFFYLRPASDALLRGDRTLMVGDGGDSVTNVWQYRLVLDVFHARPQDLLFGAAIYSDQMNAPEGAIHFMPWIERILVLLYAPFMDADFMPTAMVWGLMVLSGLCFHAYGRVLGWSRAVSFALGLAWAFCPFTRARATVHIAFVGTYWVPLLFLAVHLLARPKWLSTRAATVTSALLMLLAVFAAHYFIVIGTIFAPAFIAYYFVVLPRGASRLGAFGRLLVASAPAALFVLYSLAIPAPSYGLRATKDLVATRSETDNYLKYYGAHPLDYVLGDMKFGHHDLLPLREKLTREARVEVDTNRHERSNGIRWTVLASYLALAVALSTKRLRRWFSADERALGRFAIVFGVAAFLVALSPQGIRVYDTDLGPVQLVAKLVPRFRVPNRVGIVVHFAALLGAGVLLDRVLRRRLAAPGPAAALIGVAIVAVSVLDYLPRYGVDVAPVVPQRAELEAAAPGVCGGGITVPYVTWGFHDEDYYKMYASLRGTSCKVLHTAYLTREDEVLRVALGKDSYTGDDRRRAERLARCSGASWIMFRLDARPELRRALCDDLGWSFVTPDVCRAPAGRPLPPLRSLRECAQPDQLR